VHTPEQQTECPYCGLVGQHGYTWHYKGVGASETVKNYRCNSCGGLWKIHSDQEEPEILEKFEPRPQKTLAVIREADNQ